MNSGTTLGVKPRDTRGSEQDIAVRYFVSILVTTGWLLSGFAGSTLETTRALQTLVDAVACFVLHSCWVCVLGGFLAVFFHFRLIMFSAPPGSAGDSRGSWSFAEEDIDNMPESARAQSDAIRELVDKMWGALAANVDQLHPVWMLLDRGYDLGSPTRGSVAGVFDRRRMG